MKRSIRIFAIVLMIGIANMLPYQASAAPPFGVSFQVFYNELTPFGDWVMDPTHGYVWIPYVDGHFHPYASHGRWEMTSFGNTWVSDFAWGWAPFHYGRWFWSDFYGWAWVPGYEWGPAWVSWRTGSGFYGWAPLGPPGFNINVSAHWVFIPQRRFRHRHFARYYVPHHRVTTIYQQTTIINNTTVINNNTFYTGPSRREVERVTNTRVPVYNVRESNRPGRAVVRNNSVEMYRPQIQSARNDREAIRPSRVYTQEEFKGRNATRNASQSQGRNVSPTIQNNGDTPNRNGQASTAQTPRRANTPASTNSNNSVNRNNSGTVNQNRSATVTNERSTSRGNENIRSTAPSRNSSAPAVRNANTRSNSTGTAVRSTPSRSSSSNQPSTVRGGQSSAPKANAPSRNQTMKPATSTNRSSSSVSAPRGTTRSSGAKPSVAPSRSTTNKSATSSSSRSGSSSSRNRGNN